MTDPTTLVEAEELTPQQRGTVRAIYEDAFPEELQVPFDDLFVDRMLVLLDDDGRPGSHWCATSPRPGGRSCATTPSAAAGAAPARPCGGC